MINLIDFYEHADNYDPLFADVKFFDVGEFTRSWVLKDVPFELLTSKAMLEHIRQMALTPSEIYIADFKSGPYYLNGSVYESKSNSRVAVIFDAIGRNQIGLMKITITKQSCEDMKDSGEFKDMAAKDSKSSSSSNSMLDSRFISPL